MKIRVENLARIQEAEVEVKNLTLFVGQNSTHKSYLAHVIYELFKNTHYILNLPLSKSEFFTKNIVDKLKKIDNLDLNYLSEILKVSSQNNFYLGTLNEATLHFKQEDKLFSKILFCIHDEIVNNICSNINNSFNTDTIILEKLILAPNVIHEILKNSKLKLSFYMLDNNQNIDYILSHLVKAIYFKIIDRIETTKSLYFPASRSGYVLTLDALFSGMFTNSVRGNANSSVLSSPTIDFIEVFHSIKNSSIQNNIGKDSLTLIEYLNTEIIKGKIVEDKNEFNHSKYSLEVNERKLDLHLVSSATLETLPFIVFLKTIKKLSEVFFVIEEPEAHLHPKAQIQMARFLVMLSNAGAKVLVTTHSDYILNEINNSIKLDSIDKNSKFAISKNNVSAYFFKNEENKTSVNELAIDKFGIANDNFDEVLDELLERSSKLSEKILDDK